MAVSALLAPVSDLATLLKLTLDADDPYARLILRGASNAVRDAARQPGWVRLEEEGDEPGVGQSVAPETAADITLQVAARAYANPQNLSRRTSGPMSDSWFENGLYGLELSEEERRRLGGFAGGSSSGIWVQPIAYGPEKYPIMAPTSPTSLGDQYIGDSDQFPYALPGQ